MRTKNLPILLKAVESVFGKKVLSFTECTQLSEAVFKTTGTMLNVSTLRRVFGLVPAKHSPSAHTLHTLARYCGYLSFDELVDSRKERESDPGADISLLQYLVLLFEDTVAPHLHDVTYTNLVRHTIHFLNQESRLLEPFQKAVAKTRNGQDFYFEMFFNIDRLASSYGEGLRFYLAEKRTHEAQVFGHSLLVSRAWLVMDDLLFYRHFAEMMLHPLDGRWHPLNCGRYFGARLLNAKLAQTDPAPLLAEARAFLKKREEENQIYRKAPHFELTLSTNLVLGGEWKETLYYCEIGLEKMALEPSPGNEPLFHAFYLFKAIALASTGRKEAAFELYQEIDVHRFYFLAKKFLTILYLQLGLQLKKGGTERLQINHLVKETGFSRLVRLRPPVNELAIEQVNKNEQLS